MSFPYTIQQLSSMRIGELKDLSRKHGVKGYSKYKDADKKGLVDLIWSTKKSLKPVKHTMITRNTKPDKPDKPDVQVSSNTDKRSRNKRRDMKKKDYETNIMPVIKGKRLKKNEFEFNESILMDLSIQLVPYNVDTTQLPSTEDITPDILLKMIESNDFCKRVAKSLLDIYSVKYDRYVKLMDKINASIRKDQEEKEKLREDINQEDLDRMFPMIPVNKAFLVRLETNKKLASKKYHGMKMLDDSVIRTVRTKLTNAIKNEQDGIVSISGERRVWIRNQLCRQIFILSKGYRPFMDAFMNMVFTGPSGVGKCLARDTPVIMFDGTIRKVQDIKPGEKLMGDDSTERNVLSVTSGTEKMFRVVQNNGDAYVVNKSHIISLKSSYSPTIQKVPGRNSFSVEWKENSYNVSKIFSNTNIQTARLDAEEFLDSISDKLIIDIPITEYLKKSSTWKKDWRGFKVKVEFPEKHVNIQPYLLGLWLGDDTNINYEINTNDVKILEYFEKISKLHGFHEINKCTDSNFTESNLESTRNLLLSEIENENLILEKHIPYSYKCNSWKNRLELLAGIIDINDCLSNNSYYIIQKGKLLSEDICYLARSLGFSVYLNACENTSVSDDINDVSYHIIISGNIIEIPVLTDRNQVNLNLKIEDKHTLKTEIRIEELPEDTYYGFVLDGNSRFLLGDFTVTHNTKLAKSVGYVYEQSGILLDGEVIIVSPKDLIGEYVGSTAVKTVGVLMKSLENIIFIDEAYQIMPCVDGKIIYDKSYGPEAITEIVNFLDKYIGLSIMIVAGYQREIEGCFFGANEGLRRRFPTRILLPSYTIIDMLNIFVNEVDKRLGENIFTEETSLYIYTIMTKLDEIDENIFINQAGDIMNLASMFLNSYYGSYKIQWGTYLNDILIVNSTFNHYLRNKGYTMNIK